MGLAIPFLNQSVDGSLSSRLITPTEIYGNLTINLEQN